MVDQMKEIYKIKNGLYKKTGILILLLGLIPAMVLSQSNQSSWVHKGPDGRLVYQITSRGDKIMDFSYAGYKGGGVELPTVPAKITVSPSGGDDTKSIQEAIDKVSKMPMNNGFRGAVLLAPGVFICKEALMISTAGVVLRGSGSGNHGSILKLVGKPHTAIVIGRGNKNVPLGEQEQREQQEHRVKAVVVDDYLPSGSSEITLKDFKGFNVGDSIIVHKPITASWIHFMQMDEIYRDGKHQTWISVGKELEMKSRIKAIHQNKITLTIPLSDAYDASLSGATAYITKDHPINRVTNVGIEYLHLQCSPLEIDYGHAPYAGIRVGGDDCWVKNVFCEETMNTIVLAGDRNTMEKVKVKHTFPNLGASKPADFSLEGSQNLIDRCEADGGNTYFVWTSSLQSGPNVILNSTFRGIGSRIQPHQRWSTGLLVDNCTIPDGNIDFMNRGAAGSGHGWTMGWAVAWNCIAKNYIIQNPPGILNWAIGCIGEPMQTAKLFDTAPLLPQGVFDSQGIPVSLQSLYLAQLEERLGKKAIKNIGYSANDKKEFKNKNVKTTPFNPDIDEKLGVNLAFRRPVNTNDVKLETRAFSAEKALDAKEKTYWKPTHQKNAVFEVDMEGPEKINTVKLNEINGNHILEYKIEGMENSEWKQLAKGNSVGKNHVVSFPELTVWKVRLTILNTSGYPAISEFKLYNQKITK